MPAIHPLTMPKWGLSMSEARVIGWLKPPGAHVSRSEEMVEVESEKIAGAVEAPDDGVLRRQLVKAGDVVPVGTLVGVIADADVADAEIDALVAEFQASFAARPAADSETDTGPQKIAVGGRTLRYLARGAGDDAVILIHGFGGDLKNWLFNHEALAVGRTVYALDLPGHGESTKDVGGGTLEELAETIIAFMDAVGVPRAHLVGHSLGGAVALALAIRHPQRVLSLALLASAALGPEIDAAYVEGFVTAANRNALKPQAEKLFADPARVTRRLVDDLLKSKRIEGVDACLRRLSENLLSGGRQAVVLRDEVARLTVPVLAVWGSEDRIVPATQAAGLPANVRVEVLPGQGHMLMMEAAGEMNRLLAGFWEQTADE